MTTLAPDSAVPAGGGINLRAWQREALSAYDAAGSDDFLVTATPGAGKTAFALTLAGRLLARRLVDRVIVVCPTDHLRTQWAAAAHRHGIALDPALPNSVGPLRPDLRGYVTTYAQVAGRPALHAARTRARRTLVVLDEVHHAGDGLSWGEAIGEAFDGAVRRLALSGTPFRTRADERIPFVRYREDDAGELRSVADHGYSYAQALADGVVRPVVFAAYTGVSRWKTSAGQVVAASLTEVSTRSTEAAAWRTALDPGGQWVPHVLAAMDERITHLRANGMPDAAGLVLASDQDDARAYADIAHRITGTRPELIVSDDPKASAKIAAFNTGTTRMAVCVRMISEGVDVPRAAALAWMTSYRTPLFFAQAVGRVVRARRPGESATVFLPAVRPLLALAAELESERNHVIGVRLNVEDDLDALDLRPPRESTAREETVMLSAEAEFAHVLTGGRAVLAEMVSLDAHDEDFLGLPGLLTAEQTAALLARRDVDLRRRASASVATAGLNPAAGDRGPGHAAGGDRLAGRPAAGDPADPAAAGDGNQAAYEVAARLRREVNGLVARVSARGGRPHAAVHGRLRAAVPGPPSAAAPIDVLQRRRDYLMGQL